MAQSAQPQHSPLQQARTKTGEVQRDLKVAGAEIGLVHDALERELPAQAKHGDVAWAIGQSGEVERKLEEAAEELEEVTELLAEEAAARRRLEDALARRR